MLAGRLRRCLSSQASLARAATCRWEASPEGDTWQADAAEKILKHGFVILPSLLSTAEVATLSRRLMRHVEGTAQSIRESNASIGVGSASGFHEVVLRSPGCVPHPTGLSARETLRLT